MRQIDADKLIYKIESAPVLQEVRNMQMLIKQWIEDMCAEKDIAKEPVLNKQIYPAYYRCPECNASVTYRETYMRNKAFGDLEREVRRTRCAACGQLIKWEGI